MQKDAKGVYIYSYIFYIYISNSYAILHGMSCFVTTCMLVFVALSTSHIPLFEDFLSAFGVPFSKGYVHPEWMAFCMVQMNFWETRVVLNVGSEGNSCGPSEEMPQNHGQVASRAETEGVECLCEDAEPSVFWTKQGRENQ